MKKILFVFTLLVVFNQSSWGMNCTNCKIKNVGCSYKYAGKQSCNLIVEGVTAAARPACHTFSESPTLTRWVIDVTSEAGKAMQALAVAAQLADKEVVIYGAGVCDVWTNAETINLIYLGGV